ncbi:MAG: BatA domain-containing protein, partial [Polyangiaceae bacterium]|nr:BatA domain-containing protein [Polyangiaceae bacterium]
MRFTGLGASEVLGLFAGLAAITTALYLLKLRRRKVEVPFVHLWATVLADQKTTRLFSQLKRWLSLLLALGVVGALALALGDPRVASSTESGRTLVVLLDVSASMQSTDVGESRFEAARSAVGNIIDGLGPADRMLIATLGRTATPASPMTSDPTIL